MSEAINETLNDGKARIKVIGIGGAGGNAVNQMVEDGITSVNYAVINTDSQDLNRSAVPQEYRIRIGGDGLGAGANPEAGRKAAESCVEEIKKVLADTDMVFIAAGMGGGTGTGASPVVARLAKEMGILTVGVVTMPFPFEGKKKLERATEGCKELQSNVDTLIKISNEKLSEYMKELSANSKTKMSPDLKTAFKMSDSILSNGVQGVSDTIIIPGMMNLDFNDVKTVMSNSNSAHMGIGKGKGENRAREATIAAMFNPLLEHGIENAMGVIYNVIAGPGFTFDDLDTISEIIHDQVSDDANIIFGCVINEEFEEDELQVTIIATGFDENAVSKNKKELSSELLKREVPAQPVQVSAPKKEEVVVQKQETPVQPVKATSNSIAEEDDFWKSLGMEPPTLFQNN